MRNIPQNKNVMTYCQNWIYIQNRLKHWLWRKFSVFSV